MNMGNSLKTEANRTTGTGTGKWKIKKTQYDRLHIQIRTDTIGILE